MRKIILYFLLFFGFWVLQSNAYSISWATLISTWTIWFWSADYFNLSDDGHYITITNSTPIINQYYLSTWYDFSNKTLIYSWTISNSNNKELNIFFNKWKDLFIKRYASSTYYHYTTTNYSLTWATLTETNTSLWWTSFYFLDAENLYIWDYNNRLIKHYTTSNYMMSWAILYETLNVWSLYPLHVFLSSDWLNLFFKTNTLSTFYHYTLLNKWILSWATLMETKSLNWFWFDFNQDFSKLYTLYSTTYNIYNITDNIPVPPDVVLSDCHYVDLQYETNQSYNYNTWSYTFISTGAVDNRQYVSNYFYSYRDYYLDFYWFNNKKTSIYFQGLTQGGVYTNTWISLKAPYTPYTSYFINYPYLNTNFSSWAFLIQPSTFIWESKPTVSVNIDNETINYINIRWKNATSYEILAKTLTWLSIDLLDENWSLLFSNFPWNTEKKVNIKNWFKIKFENEITDTHWYFYIDFWKKTYTTQTKEYCKGSDNNDYIDGVIFTWTINNDNVVNPTDDLSGLSDNLINISSWGVLSWTIDLNLWSLNINSWWLNTTCTEIFDQNWNFNYTKSQIKTTLTKALLNNDWINYGTRWNLEVFGVNVIGWIYDLLVWISRFITWIIGLFLWILFDLYDDYFAVLGNVQRNANYCYFGININIPQTINSYYSWNKQQQITIASNYNNIDVFILLILSLYMYITLFHKKK